MRCESQYGYRLQFLSTVPRPCATGQHSIPSSRHFEMQLDFVVKVRRNRPRFADKCRVDYDPNRGNSQKARARGLVSNGTGPRTLTITAYKTAPLTNYLEISFLFPPGKPAYLALFAHISDFPISRLTLCGPSGHETRLTLERVQFSSKQTTPSLTYLAEESHTTIRERAKKG